MPRELEHTYKCDICGKEYTSRVDEEAKRLAEECEESHELVYVELRREEVERLLAYIFSGEDGLLTEELLNKLRKYRKIK